MAKIILTQRVSGLGEPGDVVETKDGYARNYLFPRGYAQRWTRGAQADLARVRAAQEQRAHTSLESAQAQAEALQGTPLTISVKAGAHGRLFGTVKPGDVAAAIERAGHGPADKRKIEVPHIKETGRYRATVQVHTDVRAEVDLDVISH